MKHHTQTEINRVVGVNLQRIRRAQGKSATNLARMLGISQQQVRKYETGQNALSAARLYSVSDALQVPVGTLYEGLGASPVPPEAGRDVMGLVRDYSALPSPEVKKAVRGLVGGLSTHFTGGHHG